MLTAFPAALYHPDSFKTYAGEESFIAAFDQENSRLALCEILQINCLQGKDSVLLSAQHDLPEANDLFLFEHRWGMLSRASLP